MQPLRWERRPDGLRAPALVCAFKGWNDAGEAATSALTFMGAGLDAARFALIDPEEFVDFQSTRPSVRLTDGLSRKIEWPEFEFYEALVPRAPRDLILLSGPEPAMRWRTFCEKVIELAEAIGVQMVVTLGALLADVPHTRPVSITGMASDQVLIDRLGLQPPTYEGPTGIVGVLHAACAEAGLPSCSLWAAVPHYVAVVPNPKGALAILRRLETLVGVTVDASSLEEAATDYERQVSRAVEMDPEVQAFVERLEKAAEEALRRGHEVTLFTRGRHGAELFPQARHLRGDRSHDLAALRDGEWDVVVDTSGMRAEDVGASAQVLADR